MADEFKTTLGLDAQQIITELLRVDAQFANYVNSVNSAIAASSSFNKATTAMERAVKASSVDLGKIIESGRVGQTSQEIEAALQKQVQLRTESAKTEQQLRQLFRSRDPAFFGNELEQAGKKGTEAAQSILLSWQSVIRLFTIQVLHRIVAQLTSAFVDGVGAAKEFELGIAQVQTISRDLDLSMDELKEQVIDVSREFGEPLDVVTKGLYETLSNQVGEASQSFEFLVDAQKFGTAAVTETGDAVDLLSSTLNSYNIAVSETDVISGKLFKTIELGRIRGEEFANTFGRVTVLSAQLGIELDEILASIATLTVTGLKYNEAFTLITNTEQKLINPSEALKREFNSLGIASAEAGIQAFGFQGFLEKLTDEAGDSASEIGKLFNRLRAIRGVLGLTGRQGERFNDVLQQIQEAGSEDLNVAFATIFETNAKRFEVALNDIKLLFVETFGQGTIDLLVTTFDVFGGGSDTLQSFAIAAGIAAAAYIAASTEIVASTGIFIASFTTLAGTVAKTKALLASTRTFIATPAGAAIVLAAATLTAFAAYNQFATSIEDVTTALERQIKAQEGVNVVNERLRISDSQKANKAILSDTQKFLFARQKLYQDDAKQARDLQEVVFGGISDQISDRISLVQSFADRLDDSFNSARASARDLRLELEGIGDNADAFNFERSIKGLDPQRQASAAIQRTQETLVQLNEALNAGDIQRASSLKQIADESARIALSAADESANRALIGRAEQTTRETFEAEASIKQKQIALNEQEVATATQLRDVESTRLTRLNDLFNQFNKFEAISDGLVIDPKFDPQKAEAELNKITTSIKQELEASAANANVLAQLNVEFDFENVVAQLQEQFRQPISGARIDLTPLVDISLDNIVARLRKQVESLTPQQIQLFESFGVELDVSGFSELQNQIAASTKDLDTANKATLDLQNAQARLASQLLESRTAASEFSASVDRIANRSVAFKAIFGDAEGSISSFADGLTSLIQVSEDTSLTSTLADLQIQFEKAIKSDNAREAANVLNQVNAIALQLSNQGFPNLAAQADTLSVSLSKAFELTAEVERIRELSETAAGLQGTINSLQNLNDSATQTGSSVQEGVNTADSALKTLETRYQRLNQLVEQFNANAASTNVSPTGSPLNRAMGGFARGTDNILASLTRGESVNTVSSTRQFFPQIQAMNAGVQPIFRESGGIVNNVGDINVNVNEVSNGRSTGREVAAALNREFRRNTVNLRGK